MTRLLVGRSGDDIQDRRLTTAMDTEDDTVESEHADFDEMMLNHIGNNRRGKDIGKIGLDFKGLRIGTKVVIKALGHETAKRGRFPIRLGDPESRGGDSWS